MSLFGKYRVYVIFLCVAYLVYRYTRQSKVEPFIVKAGHGNIVLSEDDVGIMLATLFNTPKLSKASFVRILKDIVDIDVSKDYSVTSGQIIQLVKKIPALKLYDAKRRRRIVHFYETDPDVKKLFDDHFITKTETFIASSDEEVMATWRSFKKLFGRRGGMNRINLRNSDVKYKTLTSRLPDPLRTKLNKRTDRLENLFKQFYKLKTGKEYKKQVDGDTRIIKQNTDEIRTSEVKKKSIVEVDLNKTSRQGNEDQIVGIKNEINELRQMVQSVVDKTMEQKSNLDSSSDDNIYDDPESDALSKKMLTYLMKKKKTVKEFETFVRVMVITGREELNPLVGLHAQIHKGIRIIVSGNGDEDFEFELEDFDEDSEPEDSEEEPEDSEEEPEDSEEEPEDSEEKPEDSEEKPEDSEEEPEAFQGWK